MHNQPMWAHNFGLIYWWKTKPIYICMTCKTSWQNNWFSYHLDFIHLVFKGIQCLIVSTMSLMETFSKHPCLLTHHIFLIVLIISILMSMYNLFCSITKIKWIHVYLSNVVQTMTQTGLPSRALHFVPMGCHSRCHSWCYVYCYVDCQVHCINADVIQTVRHKYTRLI